MTFEIGQLSHLNMMRTEASVLPLGVIALSSFLIIRSKTFSKSVLKALVCHYFYVHQMCFFILFLLQYALSFHYILVVRILGLELCSSITTAFTGIRASTLYPPRWVLALHPEWLVHILLKVLEHFMQLHTTWPKSPYFASKAFRCKQCN